LTNYTNKEGLTTGFIDWIKDIGRGKHRYKFWEGIDRSDGTIEVMRQLK
jgi:hypothetical protein